MKDRIIEAVQRFATTAVVGSFALCLLAATIRAETWTVLGTGSDSCANLNDLVAHLNHLIDDGRSDSDAAELTRWRLTLVDQWIYGFVTGAQQIYTASNRRQIAVAQRERTPQRYVSWVLDWCRENADKTVADGAIRLRNQLSTDPILNRNLIPNQLEDEWR